MTYFVLFTAPHSKDPVRIQVKDKKQQAKLAEWLTCLLPQPASNITTTQEKK